MEQTTRILEYIRQFGKITTLDAFRDLGITRLASRIYDLKKLGYKFKTTMVRGLNRFNEPIKFLEYSFDFGGADGSKRMAQE